MINAQGSEANGRLFCLTREQLETPIAELEGWGLEVMMVNFLERRFGAIYVSQLLDLTDRDVLRAENVGEMRLAGLKKALRRFVGVER